MNNYKETATTIDVPIAPVSIPTGPAVIPIIPPPISPIRTFIQNVSRNFGGLTNDCTGLLI